MAANTKERVINLEETLNRFILHTDQSLNRLSQEMQEFKVEMQEFKDEMKGFKKESQQQWGALANKLGTFAEDIAAPNIPRIASKQFGETEHHFFATNLMKNHPQNLDEVYEFDAVLETKHNIFLLETKFTVRNKYLEKLPPLIQRFQECFPAYKDKKLVTIFASMHLHESTVKRLTKMGIYAMAMGSDNMELLNFEALQN